MTWPTSQGILARELADWGAVVTGIDLSSRLLEFAAQYEEAEPRGIRYQIGDAQDLADIPDSAFDGVACSWP